MILYRPVGLQELELVYDGGMKAFPARLPQQPIFYPVLDLEYARQIASGWNVSSGQLAGYVTEFKVEDEYLGQFEEHTVGGSQHQEFWIPAEDMDEFNRHITGHIKVVEAHFGDGFQGFVPAGFGLQGKNVVEQFTLLANSFIYHRMDFYLEIKRNHKAVFLNYPFWQTYGFKNPGLKAKVIQAIKEAWLTSFPNIPLPLPPPLSQESPPVKQTDARPHTHHLVDLDDEEATLVEEIDSPSLEDRVEEDMRLVEQTDSYSSLDPDDEDVLLEERTGSPTSEDTIDEDIRTGEQTNLPSLVKFVHEDIKPVKPVDSRALVNPVHVEIALPKRAASHFSQGLEFGLSGNYDEAIGELSKAVKEDPESVIAYTSLGVAFRRSGQDDRALACYEAALKVDPKYAEAHYFRANILFTRRQVREAIAGYTTALGLEPGLIESHQQPAPQDRLTDYSAAPAEIYRIAKPAYRILAINKSLENDPREAKLLKERAAEYGRLGNHERAIVGYSAALAIQPDDASALHLRGLAYELIGRSDRAMEDYRQAATLDPQISEVYFQRGVAFGQSGNLRQSIESLTRGLRLAPESPDGYFNRGTAYFQLGDFENAIADFSTVIRLSSKDEVAYYWRGISNEQAGRWQDAIADYRQFLALSEDPGVRNEVEQRLRQWEGMPSDLSSRSANPHEGHKKNLFQRDMRGRELDLYGLIAVLGDRAARSTWFSSGLDCIGETAEELYALTDQNRPVAGGDFLRLMAGIRRTMRGEVQAFDPGETSPWIFLRAWDGSGFYIETDDPEVEEQLRNHFPTMEEVEGASPPYASLFLRV